MTTTPPTALSNVEEALVSALGDAVSTAPPDGSGTSAGNAGPPLTAPDAQVASAW